MASHYTWRPKQALSRILDKLEDAVDAASAQGADLAAEKAPEGKTRGRATGAAPRYFSVKLQTVRDFKAKKNAPKNNNIDLGRLLVLRSLNRGDLANEVKPTDVKFFRFTSGSKRGQQPDLIDVTSARGPGGQKVVGATGSYQPGTLKKGIHPLDTEREGTQVKGGFASEAPYSNVVEKGFHHYKGTQVAARPFMEPAAEELRESFISGKSFKE